MSRIDYRFAERDVGRLPVLAAQLVERKVTVVYTATDVSALAMKSATSMIPVGSRSARTRSNRVWWQPQPPSNLTGVSFFTNQMKAKAEKNVQIDFLLFWAGRRYQ